MAHPKRKISRTRKDKRRTHGLMATKAVSGAVMTVDAAQKGFHIENILTARKISLIQVGEKINDGILTTVFNTSAKNVSNIPIAMKKTQITVGGVTALIGTPEYVKKISNLPAFQINENVRNSKRQSRRKYFPKINFSGEQYQEAMHLVSVSSSINTESDKK